MSRLLWRLRRLVDRRRSRPAPIAPASSLAVTQFTVFGHTLHLAGQLPAPARSLALLLPGGETLPVPLASDHASFDRTLPIPASPREVAHARLRAIHADGSHTTYDDLGNTEADPAHDVARQFQAALAARPPGHLLEVGARARSGLTRRDWAPPGWTYSGFDILPGPNVDVVGDAHAIARHYPAASFDAVMAFSVLEHLLMPWKFVLELNRVLKPGAIGLFTTHQTWPLHDQPWDHWRFSSTAWPGLLNPATGFEILAAAMGEPAYVVAKRCSPATAFPEHPAAALASFVHFRKTAETTLTWPVDLDAITPYPA